MMNMFWEPLDFEVPVNPRRAWHLAIETFAPSPGDIAFPSQLGPLTGSPCTVQGRSVVVLESAG